MWRKSLPRLAVVRIDFMFCTGPYVVPYIDSLLTASQSPMGRVLLLTTRYTPPDVLMGHEASTLASEYGPWLTQSNGKIDNLHTTHESLLRFCTLVRACRRGHD
jgi:hypothetical protein